MHKYTFSIFSSFAHLHCSLLLSYGCLRFLRWVRLRKSRGKVGSKSWSLDAVQPKHFCPETPGAIKFHYVLLQLI